MSVRAAAPRAAVPEVNPSPLRITAPSKPANAVSDTARALTAADAFEVPSARATKGFSATDERADVARINARRKRLGKRPLARNAGLTRVARRWARHLAKEGELSHRNNLSAVVKRATGKTSLAIGENVGMGSTEKQLFGLWVKSRPHRANLDKARYDSVGVGAYRDARGTLWMVQVFADFKGR